MSDVTHILDAIEQGDPRAADQLLPLVYDELRKLAAQKLAQERPGQSLDATALVHEAYVRLVDVSIAPHWNGRGHFYAAAAEAMRRILIENVRRKGRRKRGGGARRADIDPDDLAVDPRDDELLALDESLGRLAAHDAVKARLVELRYFAGCTLAEAATHLGISLSTADRSWRYARAWLYAADAEPVLRECLAIRQKLDPDEWPTFHTQSLLGTSLLEQEMFAGAEPLLLAAYEALLAREPSRSDAAPHTTKTLRSIVDLYDRWEKKEAAESWRQKLVERDNQPLNH